jgi:transposase
VRGTKDKEHAMAEALNHSITFAGIDIGKNSFHIVGLDGRGAIVLRQKWSRGQVEARFAKYAALSDRDGGLRGRASSQPQAPEARPRCPTDACAVRSALFEGTENDFRDAEAIAEAVQRPTMKFVATKTADQLDLQAMHRVRERLVSQRTGIINQIRAFLLERGLAIRQGLRILRAELPGILAEPFDVLSPRMVRIIEDLARDCAGSMSASSVCRRRSKLSRARTRAASG